MSLLSGQILRQTPWYALVPSWPSTIARVQPAYQPWPETDCLHTEKASIWSNIITALRWTKAY